jgi:Cof subfamily protein (haloacid dehalogenase superfamily)
MPAYRLLALDLDGTLLNSSLKLSDGNAAALQAALGAGVQVVLATTRWYELAKRTADRMGIVTPIISSNGARVTDPSDGSELLHLTVDGEAAQDIVTLADDRGWEMFTTVGAATYMKMRPGVIPEKLPAGLRVAERQSDHLGEAAPTCVLVFGNDAVLEIRDRFADRYGDRVRFSFNTPTNTPHYVVVTHPQAEKASALELACKRLGIAREHVLAMGDSESDLAMLRWAGLGVAMANSPDEVKKAALHVAPSNDEDGVAWAVEKFVLK